MKKISLVLILLFGCLTAVYSQSWTSATGVLYSNPNTTKVGIGTNTPAARLDIADKTVNETKTILARLSEGGESYLGVKSYNTQPANSKMFSIEHKFYNKMNTAINFYRGATDSVGFITFDVNNGTTVGKFRQAGLDVFGRLYIQQKQPLGSQKGDYIDIRTLNFSCGINANGNATSSFVHNLWLLRDEAGNNWFTSRLHDGISIDGSYQTPGVNTRTWWERDPYDNIQSWGTGNSTYMTIKQGNVGIGKADPTNKLDVNGIIHAKEVKVDNTGWADFVFNEDYKLRPLSEVNSFIQENKHLPEIPSASEVQKEGVNLGEMQTKLLQKVEELTLYLIQQNNTMQELRSKIELLESQKQ
ncbi:hypothetical protein AGMMS49525_08470 [Bacteroidia bacterium]|nr:hypothetical protein AGMMS49525_08470 [Bacteroidia bacterium]